MLTYKKPTRNDVSIGKNRCIPRLMSIFSPVPFSLILHYPDGNEGTSLQEGVPAEL